MCPMIDWTPAKHVENGATLELAPGAIAVVWPEGAGFAYQAVEFRGHTHTPETALSEARAILEWIVGGRRGPMPSFWQPT